MTTPSLADDFLNVTIKKTPTGGLEIDVSNLKDVTDVTIITSGGVFQFKPSALQQQMSAPAIITSQATVKSFSPGNFIIRAGLVELRKISPYLADLDAKAELLVAPQDLANIDGQGLGRWNNTIKRIRQIKGYHGLDGMRIFDRAKKSPYVTYEQAWASQIRSAFEQARSTGQPVTIGWGLGTKELVHGRKIGARKVTVDNNLYSRREEITSLGDAFITTRDRFSNWQWSCTEHPDKPFYVYNVDVTDGNLNHDGDLDHKNTLRLSARPIALEIQP